MEHRPHRETPAEGQHRPEGADRVELAWAVASPEAVERGWPLLDDGERRRAEGILHEPSRLLHVAARVLVRERLGERLGVDPSRLRFQAGRHGKPRLAPPWDSSGWEFNLSHTGDRVVLALARGRAVGVDVERLEPIPPDEMARLAESFFSPAERSALQSVDAARAGDAFLRTWTRKEAVLKAAGEGLSPDLAAWDTASGPLVRGRWAVREIGAPEGHVASVAAEGLGWTVADPDRR